MVRVVAMKKVKLVFSTGTGVFSKIVRWFTWGSVSHVGVIFPNGWVVESREGLGVVKRKLDVSLKGSSRIDYRYVEVTPQVYEKVMDNMASLVGDKYDWWAILGFVFRRDWAKPGRWTCSEAIAWAFMEAGSPLLYKQKNRVSPDALFSSPRVRE